MRDVKIMGVLTLFFVILSLIFGGLGCEKEKEKGKVEKVNPLSEFKAEIVVENPPTVLKVNSSSTFKVKVKNISNVAWPVGYSINLAYHWLNKDGKVVVFDGARTPIPHDVKPNEEILLDANVLAPNQAGDYILEFDMVQEMVAWFKDKGSKTTRINIKVK
jgi:hypothetical protein